MIRLLVLLICCVTVTAAAAEQTVMIVVGAGGVEEYDAAFAQWAGNWGRAAADNGAHTVLVGPTGPSQSVTDREHLQDQLGIFAQRPTDELWIVLIGHGTFDGNVAKFNLRGPDVSAGELAQWLQPIKSQIVVINCASASGPFINALSAADRVVITSTKSGFEYNFAHFGRYLSETIADSSVDLDKDDQTSLLEAFLAASAAVADFYESQSRLATEHALLDDNGDSLGTPSDWFRGVRAVRAAADGAPVDGLRANQLSLATANAGGALAEDALQGRNELEAQIEQLRSKKPDMDQSQYYRQLETLMIKLSRIYAEHD